MEKNSNYFNNYLYVYIFVFVFFIHIYILENEYQAVRQNTYKRL